MYFFAGKSAGGITHKKEEVMNCLGVFRKRDCCVEDEVRLRPDERISSVIVRLLQGCSLVVRIWKILVILHAEVAKDR